MKLREWQCRLGFHVWDEGDKRFKTIEGDWFKTRTCPECGKTELLFDDNKPRNLAFHRPPGTFTPTLYGRVSMTPLLKHVPLAAIVGILTIPFPLGA